MALTPTVVYRGNPPSETHQPDPVEIVELLDDMRDSISLGQPPYRSVALLIASENLQVGQFVETAGYERPGDQGHGRYEIVAGGTGTADGGAFIDLTTSGLQAKLLHGSVIHAEQFGVVLDADGLMQERSAEFNAAFQYAASLGDTYTGDDAEDVESIITGGYDFYCATDFLAKDTLELMEGNGAARAMNIHWSGHVIAVSGGTLEDHTHERPIPLVHFKLRNCKVYWPRFECEMLCAGIKGKTDLANEHYNLELRGFHRYGLWVVANNDSTWWDPIIKQFVRNPEWIRNGVDTTDWAEWNADCIIVTTKDRRFYGGQVGWGGPAARITDTMPDDADQRIPGQNCYWCGLSASQGYVDGDNGGGDVVFNDLHMMQGLSNDAFPDAGIEPRYGVYADYDLSSGNMVFREVDSPIGVLSFCKIANLSKFNQIDNDQCVHLLFGAQIEMEGELTGSQAAPLSASTATGTLLDPRIRIFASRGSGGGQRYPFMSSMARQRQMTIGFYDNPSEIYWNGSALVEASTSWNGDFDEWNRLNRASGSYAGQVQYRGRRATAGAWAPSVNAAGDYWVIHNAVTVNPGSVDAADGQILYALTASPASAGDWLVVDADSAPVRQTSRWETNVLPHIYNLFPAAHGDWPQIYNSTGDTKLEERFKTPNGQVALTLDDDAGAFKIGTTYAAIVSGKPLIYDQFTTRAALVSFIASYADVIPTNGVVRVADGLSWQKVSSSSAIPDMPNFVPIGDAYPNHFGANTSPGTTDMTTALHAWAAYCTAQGCDGYLKGEEYLFDKSAAGRLDIDGFTAYGVRERTIINSATSASNEAVHVKGTAGGLVDTIVKGYPLIVLNTGSNLRLWGIEVECSDNASSVWESAVKIADSAQIDGLTLNNFYFHHVLLGLFSADNFGNGGGYVKHTSVTNGRWRNCRKTGLVFNSNIAISGATQPWQGMFLDNLSFDEYAGETDDRATAIGLDNVIGLKVGKVEIAGGYGNVGSGTGDAVEFAIHLENLSNDLVIDSLTIRGAKRGMIVYSESARIVINSFTISGDEGHADGDDVTAFDAPVYGSNGSNGLYVVSDGGGQPTELILGNGTITNFNVGLTAGGNTRTQVTGEVSVSKCSLGAAIHANTLLPGLTGVTFDQCRYVIGSVSASSNIGATDVRAQYCGDLVHLASLSTGGTIAIDGLTWKMRALSVVGDSTETFDMFTMPDIIDTKVSAQIFKEGAAIRGTVSSMTLTYDGSTLASTRSYIAPTSFAANSVYPPSAADSQFSVNSGNLACEIRCVINSGTAQAAYAFKGLLAYQV